MKSKTKNLITEKQIKNLVRVNFGDTIQVGQITELKGGMFNSAYLIERVKEGDSIVLKVSVAPGTSLLTYEKDLMSTEVEVYGLIAKETTIPTPRILACDFSKKHIAGDYFFMTALKGQAMNQIIKNISKDNIENIKIELAG